MIYIAVSRDDDWAPDDGKKNSVPKFDSQKAPDFFKLSTISGRNSYAIIQKKIQRR